MRENYYALMVAILKDCSPEQAFQHMDDPAALLRKAPRLDQGDVADMVALKQQGLTYREIGLIYNKKPDTVYSIIRRARNKLRLQRGVLVVNAG